MQKKDIPFKTLLDQETATALESLALMCKQSKAQIVRECVLARAAMQLHSRPTCAHGKPCLVAAMHLVQSSHATMIDRVSPEQQHLLVHPIHPAALVI
jgi:hypothetical protein